MCQAIRDDGDWDAIVQHLRRHEVTEVVQPKVRETCIPSATDERLRHPVREPGSRAVVATREHETIGIDVFSTGSFSKHAQSRDGQRIDRDAVRSPRLRRCENRSCIALDEGSLEAQRAAFEIDVSPTQCEELATSGAGRRAEEEERTERFVGL